MLIILAMYLLIGVGVLGGTFAASKIENIFAQAAIALFLWPAVLYVAWKMRKKQENKS